MMRIKHAAWPTEVPPVTTYAWTQADWDRFAERYRPEWYKGGIYDYAAYEAQRAERAELHRQELLAQLRGDRA